MTLRAMLALLLTVHLYGCGCTQDDTPMWDGFLDTEGDLEADSLWDSVADTAYETPPVPDVTTDDVCDEQNFEMHHEIVRLMLLLDQSGSMQGTPWNEATSALQALLENPAFYDMYFGLDAFPDGYPGGFAACMDATILNPFPCMRCTADSCGTEFEPQVPLLPQYMSATNIIAHMNNPILPHVCSNTPLVDALAYYAEGAGPTAAPDLYSDDGSNYIVVISDGEDTCDDGDPVSKLAGHTTTLLDTFGIKSFAIGFGSTSGSMASELNAIASNGGTSFTTFLVASDGAALEAALEDIASDVLTCRYVLDDVAPSADPELVNFYIGGAVVPFDEDCTETTGSGWHWFDDAHTTVEFCGDYCADIKDGLVDDIGATFGCDTFII